MIEVSSWDKSMQEFGVSKDIADRLRSKHMRRLLKDHEYVLQSYWAQRFGEGQRGERKGNKGVKRRSGDLEASEGQAREGNQLEGRKRRKRKVCSSGKQE